MRYALSRDLHLRSRPRISPLPLASEVRAEGSEPPKFNSLSLSQSLNHGIQDSIEYNLRIPSRDLEYPPDLRPEIGLRHFANVIPRPVVYRKSFVFRPGAG